MELQETRELERNQKESLQIDDFAISSDEDEEVEANELEAAKLNLGVRGLFLSLHVVRYRGGGGPQRPVLAVGGGAGQAASQGESGSGGDAFGPSGPPARVLDLGGSVGAFAAQRASLRGRAGAVLDGGGLRGLPVAAVAELRAAAAELPASEGRAAAVRRAAAPSADRPAGASQVGAEGAGHAEHCSTDWARPSDASARDSSSGSVSRGDRRVRRRVRTTTRRIWIWIWREGKEAKTKTKKDWI